MFVSQCDFSFTFFFTFKGFTEPSQASHLCLCTFKIMAVMLQMHSAKCDPCSRGHVGKDTM